MRDSVYKRCINHLCCSSIISPALSKITPFGVLAKHLVPQPTKLPESNCIRKFSSHNLAISYQTIVRKFIVWNACFSVRMALQKQIIQCKNIYTQIHEVHRMLALRRNHFIFWFRTLNISYIAHTITWLLDCRIKSTKAGVADAGSEFCLLLYPRRYVSRTSKSATVPDFQLGSKNIAGTWTGKSSIVWLGHTCW